MTSFNRDAVANDISRAYSLPEKPVDRGAVAGVLDDLADPERSRQAINVVEVMATAPRGGRELDQYVEAVTPLVSIAGGQVVGVTSVIQTGTGDMSGYRQYAGGTALVLSFPSTEAYVAALAMPEWQRAAEGRNAAVTDALVLVCGPDTIPPMARAFLGEPRMADEIPAPLVAGKSPRELVDELLQIYPDGGADPTRKQLEVMADRPGFDEQPVHFINLYAYTDRGKGGASELDEYNAAASTSAQAHGAHPIIRTEVRHRIMSEVAWDRLVFVRWPSLRVFFDLRLDPSYIEAQRHRVASAEVYGNFMTVKWADRIDADRS